MSETAPSPHVENHSDQKLVQDNLEKKYGDPLKEKAVNAINQLLAFEDISTNEKMEKIRNKISGVIKKSNLEDSEKEIYKQTLNGILVTKHNFVEPRSEVKIKIKSKKISELMVEKTPEAKKEVATTYEEDITKMGENIVEPKDRKIEIEEKENGKEPMSEVPKKIELVPFHVLIEQITKTHPLVNEEEISASLKGAIQAYYNHYKATRSKMLGVTFTEANGFPNGSGYSCVIKAQYDNGDLKIIRASLDFKKAKIGKDLNNLKEVETCKWLILDEKLYV